jgi:hypothetical protein
VLADDCKNLLDIISGVNDKRLMRILVPDDGAIAL